MVPTPSYSALDILELTAPVRVDCLHTDDDTMMRLQVLAPPVPT